MPVADTPPTVLVVDDEAMLTDAYTYWLDDDYTVKTANDGEAALTVLDETVDVVLLDRQMPVLSGEETLERIREQDYQCRVAIVTAEEPDFDIVAMEFDTYLTKPVTKDALQDVIEDLLALETYDEQVRNVVTLAEKYALVKASTTERERANNDAFERLSERLEAARSDLDDSLDEIGAAGHTGTFIDL